jgi:hypothetical protein
MTSGATLHLRRRGSIRPARDRRTLSLVAPDVVIDPNIFALLTVKYWGGGVRLTVFSETGPKPIYERGSFHT